MTEEVYKEFIRNNKLVTKRDWFADIFGLIPYLFFWIISILIFFFESGGPLSFIFFLTFGYASIYGIYSLTQENKLSLIETESTAISNRILVISAIQQLGWSVLQNKEAIVTAIIHNKLGFINQKATVIIANREIYVNVKHEGTNKGRIPFYFGLNEKRKDQLIEEVELIKSNYSQKE